MLHRDLTPLNVFVCEGPSLKLGDFGIVRQQSDGRGITARTHNALTAPGEILAGAVPKWQTRDEVYQVGQLLGMLIKGDASVRPPPARSAAAPQRPPQGDRAAAWASGGSATRARTS
jgi:serine/threonine protein kinase